MLEGPWEYLSKGTLGYRWQLLRIVGWSLKLTPSYNYLSLRRERNSCCNFCQWQSELSRRMPYLLLLLQFPSRC